MFISRKRYERIRIELQGLWMEWAELARRVDILEAFESKRDEEADAAAKAEKLYMDGLSNVMNYSLETLKKEADKLGG